MATATKKPPAAAKSAKAAKPEPKSETKATPKPAAAKPETKAAAKPAAKAGAKAPAKSRAKKVVEPPPPVVYVSAYTVGNKVTHPSFGDGKVLSVDRDQLRIQFGKDEKVILDGFVKMGSKG